ncbi:PQQ-binding-like beta-propeller repeat protein [Streptomyces sp. NPDC048172]|uniref:outer membrane protein assembly factor BamB family protein n=1 Tax=Streptomyces sp. NPDC048172 TaxID=3365505 RepID=UPI003712F89E
MSQPPPPPSQPPPGGFGAPQEPPQGQPGQPSYGYPQQPGQPPQQPGQPPQAPQAPPGGYGYPQQPGPPGQPPQTPPPGGGFGAPTPPMGQPGPYGQQMGQQPGMYTTQPMGSAGGPGRNNNKVIIIVAAVVAVLLVAGGSVFFLTKDDGGDKKDESKGKKGGTSQGVGGSDPNAKPKSTKGKQIVDIDAPKVKDVTTVVGAWSTGKVFAKSTVNALIGMDLATNKQKYKLPLKGNVCAASNETTKDGLAAMVVQETISSGADCTRMVIVDVNKGKILQDKTMPNADTRSIENVAISGDTVASAWIGGSAGYKISTGKKIWSATPSTCRDVGYAGGKSLVAVVECGNDLDNPEVSVQKLDPDTGKANWKYKMPKGAKNVRVASTDPVVLVAGAGDELTSDIFTVGEDKKLKAKISMGKRYNKPCELEVDGCYGMAVDQNTVYLSTAEHSGSSEYGRTNEVMAFDFNTGRAKWKSPAGEKRAIIPFKTQGSNVLAYKLPSYDSGGEIVSLDPQKGKQTRLLKMPVSDVGEGEQAINVSSYSVDQPIVWDGRRMFLSDKLISERSSSVGNDVPKLAVGFGAE